METYEWRHNDRHNTDIQQTNPQPDTTEMSSETYIQYIQVDKHTDRQTDTKTDRQASRYIDRSLRESIHEKKLIMRYQ